MDSYGAGLVLDDVEELGNDVAARTTSVREIEVRVVDAMVGETLSVVLRPVQAYDVRDFFLAECRHIVLRHESRVPVGVSGTGARLGESEQLIRNDPLHVAVLDLLHELVGGQVEGLEVKPSVLDALLQTIEAVHDGELESGESA
jgi:hypothetical protein